MSKIVFRMRLPSPNLVVEVDEAGGVTTHGVSTAYAARELDLQLGGSGQVVDLSEIVAAWARSRLAKSAKLK